MLFIQLYSIFRRLTDILRKNPVRTTKIAGSLEVDDLAYNRSEADEGKNALTSGMLNLISLDYRRFKSCHQLQLFRITCIIKGQFCIIIFGTDFALIECIFR